MLLAAIWKTVLEPIGAEPLDIEGLAAQHAEIFLRGIAIVRRLSFPLIIVALAVTAFVFRERWLPQPPGQFSYLGYVEGETTLVGAPQAGRLVSVAAVKGQAVKQGTVLFALDPAQATADVARAEAAVPRRRATRDNLLTGKRQEEIDVIRAQIAQAEASLGLAQKEMQRASTLASTGTAAQSAPRPGAGTGEPVRGSASPN